MKRYILMLSFILASLAIMNCEKVGDDVNGSLDHDIQSAYATEPQILADGVSTTEVVANVRTKDGSLATNMTVHFETTLGMIEEYAVTSNSGVAMVTLTSVASKSDLTAKITATVLDTSTSALKKVNSDHYTVALSIPGSNTDQPKISKLKKAGGQQDNQATIYVKFLGIAITSSVEEAVLPADGISKTRIQVEIRETTSFKPINDREVNAYAKYGSIQGTKKTDENGCLDFYLMADNQARNDTLRIEFGNKFIIKYPIRYVNPKFTLTPRALQVPADGQSRIQIVASMISYQNTPIIGAEVKFSTTAGVIPASALTDKEGNAIVDLIASTVPDPTVRVIARFHTLTDTAVVAFVTSNQVTPMTIILNADPNFIWVKETGNIDQTILSATVLGVNNQPLGNDIKVKFFILNGPGGGEVIEPSSSSHWVSNIVSTVNGVAQSTIRSGTKSGTVQIKAQLVDHPDVLSQTTNIVIRSGPPYIWIDPSNANHVIHHATLAVEPGKFNTCFGNPIQDIQVTAYFGDVYNNPVEDGTAVYFTTTGGIITSDATTCEKGQASVILQNVNPFPYLVSQDPNQLTPLIMTNPNNDHLKLNLTIPDFERGEVVNSIGTKKENDGIAVLLAHTWGKDQNGKLVKVWIIGEVIYSVGVAKFTAVTNKKELLPGEVATISIRLYDYNGNPVAAGSSLTASTTAGELSETDLMPDAVNYGYGQTFFTVQLLNNLNPEEDKATTALVKIKLDSPNGTGTLSISISLKI